MATLRHLGMHKPAALDFLIAEAILPPDPSVDLYRWTLYDDGSDDHGEEEIVATDTCVVWSQGTVVRRIFRFDHEAQKVQDAVLTWFGTDERKNQTPTDRGSFAGDRGQFAGPVQTRDFSLGKTPPDSSTSTHAAMRVHSRALVVFLSDRAHIYTIDGASHVVSLPFEVDKTFPTPKGLILQKRPQKREQAQPTPLLPQAPQNSFWSSQVPVSSPHASHGLLRDSSKASHGARKDIFGMSNERLHRRTEDLPRLYALTELMSQLSLVVEASESSASFSTLNDLEPPHEDEEMLYMSSTDELSHNVHRETPLLLAVTVNHTKRVYTLWHVCYATGNSKQAQTRGPRKSTSGLRRSKRRSSLNSRLSTGVATPVHRANEVPRDETIYPQPFATFESSQPGRDRLSESFLLVDDDDVTGAFNSQEAPDFPGRTLSTKGNRRTSSRLARAELTSQDQHQFMDMARNPQPTTNSFGGSARKGYSFGATNDRSSFGRNRMSGAASTPGSVSFLSDVDESLTEADDAQALEGWIASGRLEMGGSLLENPRSLKRDVVFVKAFSIPVMSNGDGHVPSLPLPEKDTKVTMLVYAEEENAGPTRQRCASALLSFPTQQKCYEISFVISTMESKLSDSGPQKVAFPERAYHIHVHSGVVDVGSVLQNRTPSAVLLKHSPQGVNALGIVITIASLNGSTVTETTRTNLVEIRTHLSSSSRSVGTDDLKRLIIPIDIPAVQHGRTELATLPPMMHFGQIGTLGRFNLTDNKGECHRFQLHRSSRSRYFREVLRALETILPTASLGQHSVYSLWELAVDAVGPQKPGAELDSLTVTILSTVLLRFEELRGGARRASEGQMKPPVSSQTDEGNVSTHVTDLQAQSGWRWAACEMDGQYTTPSELSKCLEAARAVCDHIQPGPRDSKSSRSVTRISGEREKFASSLLATLALIHFEQGLELAKNHTARASQRLLARVIVQIGRWLNWSQWSGLSGEAYYFDVEGLMFDNGVNISPPIPHPAKLLPPPPLDYRDQKAYLEYLRAAAMPSSDLSPEKKALQTFWRTITPKTQDLLLVTAAGSAKRSLTTEIAKANLKFNALETLPESLVTSLRDSLKQLQIDPPSILPRDLARLAGREDLCLLRDSRSNAVHADHVSLLHLHHHPDLQTICKGDEKQEVPYGRLEANESLLAHVFREDKRWLEAARLIDPVRVAVAVIQPHGVQTETEFLEAQKAKAQLVYQRTMALPSGQAIMRFGIHKPILTEKIKVTTFNTTCNMQPSNNSVNADKSNFTEEKVGWAFFHAGVNAGLQIAWDAPGIDTPWLILNKPQDLGNRHAGLLLALGLNGHLKNMAKWLAFKYLTPKHTMTSVGLLFGLAASHIGTMDTLITRLLSVHVSRLLPPGAAELNLSGLTQTAGVIGVGLLYYNTSHRRMSEVMLSEIEHVDLEEPDAGQDGFRDEGYRLAAGFALGLINLGKGKDLRALHDMQVIERLLQVATGPREINLVHVLDQATAGAVIAIALVFLKSHDKTIARQVDIPKRSEQFDAIRPDILLLRTVANWLIMWDDIKPESDWIKTNVPKECPDDLLDRTTLRAADIPYYNILAGMCWALALKYAGSASQPALDILSNYYTLVLTQLDQPAKTTPSFDERLARDALLRWQHLLALAMATIFAGTGNLDVLRHLRGMHADLDNGKTFGFHLAAHQAIGLLFLGQGRYTLGTSDLAVASMLAAFYPIFPKDVLDNKAHLQALRHMWVFAAENRCLVPRDVETREIVHVPIKIVMRGTPDDNGTTGAEEETTMVAPCLLPELATILRIETTSAEHWPVTLDFARIPEHTAAFRRHQTVFLRRKPLTSQHPTLFASTLAQLVERTGSSTTTRSMHDEAVRWVFGLDAFKDVNVDGAAAEVLALGRRKDGRRARDGDRSKVRTLLDPRTTAVDDIMALSADVDSDDVSKLVGLKWLLERADEDERRDEKTRWLRHEWVEGLRTMVGKRAARMMDGQGVAADGVDGEDMVVD